MGKQLEKDLVPGFPLGMPLNPALIQTAFNMGLSRWYEWVGLMRDVSRFMDPFWSAVKSFEEGNSKEAEKQAALDAASDYMKLLFFNMELGSKIAATGFDAMSKYHGREMLDDFAVLSSLWLKPEDAVKYSKNKLKLVDTVVNLYPEAIRNIKSLYGFHFESGGYVKLAETERFTVYQVLPTETGAKVNERGKPTLIIPPYILGANILALLPGENRSYVHAFANHGIPTYIRVLKDIRASPAVQIMTGEDDARDMKYLAQQIMARHGKPVTLNGYCQGGFMSVLGLLSGELDDVVDALITCVTPLDGSRSKSLVEYINHLPPHFRELDYAVKILPNGNRVVDGKVMGLTFKLRSIEKEAPIQSFYRDLAVFEQSARSGKFEISNFNAAINHWLIYDRTDVPVEITRLSFKSFTRPVEKDGTLPVRLFGRPLNFRRLKEKGIKWLLCIAEADDLIDEEAALAPLDWVDADVAIFPKGHAAIATTWSSPAAACSLDLDFFGTACSHGQSRGPVRFQLDLDDDE